MTVPDSPAVIGVDLGTSSMKGILVTADGRLHGRTRVEYPMHSPHPDWNENAPDDWRRAFDRIVTELAATASRLGLGVRGIGLVAQRDPFVLLDEAGTPVTPAISWTDQRARAQTARVRERVGSEELIRIGGARPIVGLGLGNLLWTRDELPDAWRRAVRAVSPKDYVLAPFAQRRQTDLTTPTRSMAYDIGLGEWSTHILAGEGMDDSLFDSADLSPEQAWGVLGARAGDYGVDEDTVLATGGADDQAATLGGGAAREGEICLGTGTCSDWRLVLPSYAPDLTGIGDTAPHVVPGLFIREVTIDSAGSSLRWFRRTMMPGLSYEEIIGLAATAPPGAGGVRFYPFVDGGQRAPYYLDDASGAFIGMTGHHGPEHLARAVLEGIAFLYPQTRRLLLEATGGGDDRPLTIVDGEAGSAFWNQLKADVLGIPVRAPVVTDAAAMGAAILAAVSAGLFGDAVEASDAMVSFSPAAEPEEKAHQDYEKLREEYEWTFQALRPAFGARDGGTPA